MQSEMMGVVFISSILLCQNIVDHELGIIKTEKEQPLTRPAHGIMADILHLSTIANHSV